MNQPLRVRSHLLAAERVHYQWDPAISPVLEVDSGEEVVVDTRILTEDQILPGATSEAILQVDWSRIHPLTGPIWINGAEPGDAVEVRVNSLRPGSWGLSWIDPTYGLLKEDFSEPYVRFFDLTRPEGDVEFAPGVLVRLAPFLGVMGVAPPEGPLTTYAPGSFGGNLDCKELTVGSRLFLPVFVEGAKFSTGDGHAVQGDGEICSAIECAMTARLEFHLHKHMRLTNPRVETERAIMTIGHGQTLEEATRTAAREMVQHLVENRGFAPADAYLLCSLAGDPRINELVNGNPVYYGARYELPRSVLGE